ncbi:MAG TPA: hypothetical protein VG452_08325 [Egibacteraceae bacterium]|nr:hypothetical protein [Egibacteraceae bacterium]
MLRTDLPDHRRSSQEQLLEALRERDALALAEAYHRTIAAAHACARRLLSSSSHVEALLRAVYAELWAQPPRDDEPLEGWIRARCFELGTAHLRERGMAPASPSLAELVPDLPAPDLRHLDAAERALSQLDPAQRRTVLLAHDRGVPAGAQDDEAASEALLEALVALAAAGSGSMEADAGDGPGGWECWDLADLGDWALGLVHAARADDLERALADRPECAELSRTLRKGRRRLEGLPPTQDMGQRILAVVLADAPAAEPRSAPAPPAPQMVPSGPDLEASWAPPRPAADEDAAVVPVRRPAADSAGTEDPTEDLTDVHAVVQADQAAGRGPEASAERAPPASRPTPARVRAPRARSGLSMGQRALRLLGGLLLLLLGTALGLYLGFLIVQAL